VEKHGDENVFIQFTDHDKIGINPKNKFSTPIGIYSYPISLLDIKNKNKIAVPFAGGKGWINIFKPKQSSTILDLGDYGDQDLFLDCQELKKYVLNKIDKSKFVYSIDEMIAIYSRNARVKTPGGKIWNITREFAELLSDNNVASSDRTVVWTTLLKKVLGYGGAVDLKNKGIIHEGEPTQAVWFGADTIDMIARVKNHVERLSAVDDALDIEKIKKFNELIKLCKEVRSKLQKKHQLEKFEVRHYEIDDFKKYGIRIANAFGGIHAMDKMIKVIKTDKDLRDLLNSKERKTIEVSILETMIYIFVNKDDRP
jgi:hypothetical protein